MICPTPTQRRKGLHVFAANVQAAVGGVLQHPLEVGGPIAIAAMTFLTDE
jgi:hypothetical protein